MLDAVFVQAQRERLLRRLALYLAIASGAEPTRLAADRRRKLAVAREVIPVALARIEAGAYGVCVDCEEDIPIARLRTVPAALRCVACESVRQFGRT